MEHKRHEPTGRQSVSARICTLEYHRTCRRILRYKYESSELSAVFAAVKAWDDYFNCYNLYHDADLLIQRLSTLYSPFFIYDKKKPWCDEATAALSKALRDEETSVELWYPVMKCSFECVVASVSLLPVIAYYLHKIEE